MEKKSSILGGAILLTATNLFLRLISILFNVFLSDQIGASGLGLLQLISTVGLFSMLVGTSGVRVSAMYLSAEEFGHRRLGGVRLAMNACIRYGLLISSIVGIVQFFLADYLANAWLGDGRAALSLRAMAILLPFSCLCGIMTGYFTACSRIRQLVVIEIGERLVCLAITAILLMTWAKGDLEKSCCAITLGSSLGAVFDFVFLYAVYRRDMRHVVLQGEQRSMRQRLLRLCIPLALNDYLRSGLNTVEQLLIPYGLARYGGSSEQAMANYGTIHAMVFPILMFPAAVLYSVSDLLVPELSRCRAMGRRLRIIDLTDKCLRLCVLFACAVAGFLFLTADPLGVMIYKSSDVGIYLKVFAPMILMLYLDAIVDGMLKGLAEQISCVRYNTFTSVLDVVFLFVLLPRWGIGGYVFSFLITHAINLYLSLQRLLKVSEHKLRFFDLLHPIVCLFPSVVIASTFASDNIYLKGGFFLCILSALFVLTNAFREKDRTWLRDVFSSIDRNKKCG
ncbi:MAG: hypothetical protein E7434_05030 [Ruminococcaceae bacterium]|nr:hypothetical protein [Oscillospiraceae bacterium]